MSFSIFRRIAAQSSPECRKSQPLSCGRKQKKGRPEWPAAGGITSLIFASEKNNSAAASSQWAGKKIASPNGTARLKAINVQEIPVFDHS